MCYIILISLLLGGRLTCILFSQCSGDSPCSTCASVESARLWKQPCIRTRLAEEFELYTAGTIFLSSNVVLCAMLGFTMLIH